MITGLVIIMMLLLEYLNIENHGKWFRSIQHSPIRQVLAGTILGAIPGCVGGFAAVSLYTHSVIGFGALIAAMIVSTGDEAFLLLASSPSTYLKLLLILAVIAMAAGITINLLKRKSLNSEKSHTHNSHNEPLCPETFKIHHDEDSQVPSVFRFSSYKALKDASARRITVMAGIILFIAAMATGLIEDSAEESFAASALFNEKWIYAVFGVFALFTLLMTATAKEHFIKEHIWDHIIKKHLASVFLWTLGALVLCGFLVGYLDTETWISTHSSFVPLLILLAAAIGLIPQSGPHIVFILLYLSGSIPFCVLIASAITQQGHVSLPLLAQNKKQWVLSKILCAIIGISAGMAVYLLR